MTTTHRTETGSVRLVDSWGHGRAPRANWIATPAVITTDDDDGHYEAWVYTGRFRDAARVIGGFFEGASRVILADPDARTVTSIRVHDALIPSAEPDVWSLNKAKYPLAIDYR